jgi:hypothetical protein
MKDGRTEVEIGDFSSTVRAVDGGALLAPRTLRRIVEAVMEALDARDRHRTRVRAERRVTAGIVADMDLEAEEG